MTALTLRRLYHPDREQIMLPAVLDALSDPTRLAIAVHLSRAGESACGDYTGWASKTNLSYHLAKLRESGVIRSRIAGTYRLASLRREDLEARFPGLLKQIIDTAARDPVIVQMLAALNATDARKAPAKAGKTAVPTKAAPKTASARRRA